MRKLYPEIIRHIEGSKDEGHLETTLLIFPALIVKIEEGAGPLGKETPRPKVQQQLAIHTSVTVETILKMRARNQSMGRQTNRVKVVLIRGR